MAMLTYASNTHPCVLQYCCATEVHVDSHSVRVLSKGAKGGERHSQQPC